jgi:hypothetical protein
MPNSADSGAAGSRLAMARGPSWPLRTPLQPASGWPSHCTILAKHGGIASTLRTLLTSPLGLVRCPGPKMPKQRGCFFAAMQRRAAWVRASIAVWNFARSAPTSAIRGVGDERSTAVNDRSGVAFLKNSPTDLAVASDRCGFMTGRQPANSQFRRTDARHVASFGPGSENRHRHLLAERKPAFRRTGPIN